MLASIKRLAKVTGMDAERLAELDILHQDINRLKEIRDDLAHKVWAVRGNEMSFSNAHVSRYLREADFEIYTIDELNELARYAPHLSERALNIFPGAVSRGGDYRFLPKEKPARLTVRPTVLPRLS
jgi:hypothetical protein